MTRKTSHPIPWRRLALSLAIAVALSTTGAADDRDLVKESGREPYLFVIFDVSGSMNWTPPDPALGLPEDRWAPGYGDDPNSKFYQAKSALFTVLREPDLQDIFWGFATYNQDNTRAYRKHWLYTPIQAPPWAADLPYPMPGQPKHFGDHCMDDRDGDFTCDFDAANAEVVGDTLGACDAPQDLANTESFGELMSFPVLGDDGTVTTVEWVRSQGREFRVTWVHFQGAYGDDVVAAHMRVEERDDCGVWLTPWNDVHIQFTKVYDVDNNNRTLSGGNDVLMWQIDDHTDGAGNPAGFWDAGNDTISDAHCNGWESNSDSSNDDAAGVNLKYLTTPDPLARHAWAFDRGDVIPLDWQDEVAWGVGNSNRDLMLLRLAPSYDGADPATADFRVARYFENRPDTLAADGGQGRLELKPQYVDTPPLLPNGSTPIGDSMYDFMQWYDQWRPVADGASGDPFFGCRTVNLLILTDGDETCYQGSTGGTTDGQGDRNPCWIADRLLTENNRNVRTFVIGFGVPGSNANFLNCIAQRGGTDALDLDNDGVVDVTGPILPGNEQELVDALQQIASAVKSQTRSFASAAVPQAQVNVDDKVYLTSFLPIAGEPIWPGRLDAYLRPVPLRQQDVVLPDGRIESRLVPDPTRQCSPTDETECHLWNSGEELLLQAANSTEVADGSFNLGLNELERRVYYALGRSAFELPAQRQFFQAPADSDFSGWQDLLVGLGICGPADLVCPTVPANRADGIAVLEFTHRIKTAEDPNNPGVFFDYILGDFFHSDPLVYGNPDNFGYWVADVEGSGTLPLSRPCDSSPDGYRCFFAKQRNRRKMLFSGTNDGQLHVFDAGSFQGTCESNPITGQEFVVGEFDNGSGRELFSYVPRTTMPLLRSLENSSTQEFSVDGRTARGDVFIDPDQSTGVPVADEREWRSVVIGTLREGGSGLFALDVTQPDQLLDCDGTPTIPQPRSGALDYVPSCINGGAGCGTMRFPEVLWEFEDDFDCANQLASGRCDDDLNGLSDLADTWSRPTIARIRVIPEGARAPEDRYVAVFGGGMDAQRKGQVNVAGNFLYMLDIETGRAIYKRAVVGSALADPAVVDTDQDSLPDTIYFGTTAGFLYKVDISAPQDLVDLGSAGFKVISPEWDPFPILDTGGRPLPHEPTVVFVAELGKYAVGAGTGDREDLWSTTQQTGRFFMFLDRSFRRTDTGLPLTASDLQAIDPTDSNTNADFLRQTPFGWFIELETEERVISEAFSLAGVTVFSSFQPEENVSPDGTVCQRFGNSRVFVVTTTSANSLLSSGDRYFLIEGGFLSPPFAETSQTKNPPGGSGGPTGDDIPDDLVQVVDEIKSLLPTNCRFANYTINLKAVRDDTGIQFLAAIPICTIQTNWKDF